VLRPPQRPAPLTETIEALIEHYREDRMSPGARLEVGFFHGVPDEAQLAVSAPHPIRVACSPADLDRATVARLQAAGVETIELEVLTFDGGVLRDLRRGYSAARAKAMLLGLRALGVRTGAVLAPGLPGSSHDSAVMDARVIAESDPPLADFVRLIPALALRGAPLCAWVQAGRWSPMSIAEAATTCHACLDVLDAGDVPVVRVGLQAGPDVSVPVVAGPAHPDLRGLVEVRRFHRRMAEALAGMPRSRPAVVRVNPRDLSWAKGTANANVRALRAELGLVSLRVEPDPEVPRGRVQVASAR
jgi:histone acetyltransferase (RNA polymerase elongator complex component)